MASTIKVAGKLISTATATATAFRFVPKKNITTITGHFPSLEILKACAKKQAEFYESLSYNLPPPTFHELLLAQISPYATLSNPLVPLAAVVILNHSCVFAYLMCKDPDNVKEMPNERFERVCAISTFVCSPAKTIATYKNLLLSEVRQMRKQAKIENKKLMQHGSRTYEYVTFPDYMLVSLDSCVPPGHKFELFVCSSYLIVIGKLAHHSPIVITHELPDYAYFAKGVSATVAKEKVVIQFKKSVNAVGADEDNGNPFKIPIEVF